MPTFQNPVIVVPGITASDLHDDYPLKTDDIWTMVFNKDFERVALHPDDLRYEAKEPAHIVTGRAFPVYNDLVHALRHELSPRADAPTPVFLFPYDWRQDVRLTARSLGTFVDEVISRTKLLKHYAGGDDLKVDLVGHSMGGLVITEYMAQAGRKSQVGKVATLGTPYLGSIEAIVKITTGMSLLAGSEPKERERETARVTPAVYQLLPWYAGAALREETFEQVDLLDPANMQSSVVSSLQEFVRIYSVNTRAPDRKARAQEILAELLAGGRAMRDTVRTFTPAQCGLRRSDWLVVVGIGENTRTGIEIRGPVDDPWFYVDDEQFESDIPSGRTGDHTVPLPGATPPFIPASQIVAVMKKDLGFWEIDDKVLVHLGGFHGLLPKVNLVQRLVTKFLRPSYRGKTWGRRLPSASSWNPPVDGLKDKEKREY